VTLELSNEYISVNERKENYIEVLNPFAVEAQFSATPTEGTFPLIVLFNDNSIGPITSWLWDFGDGNVSTNQNPSHTYITEGKFTIKLKISNEQESDSLTKADLINIIDPDRLTADFLMDTIRGGAPLVVNFTDVSIGNVVNWFWEFGDGETSTLQNPTHTFYNPGNYNIQLIVSNNNFRDSIQKEVIVEATWTYRTGGNVYSSPAIDDNGTVYFGSDDTYLYSIKSDGIFNWKFKTGNDVISSPVVGKDGTIYVGSEDDYLYAINQEGELKWKYKTGSDILSSPSLGIDDAIYFGSNDSYFYALDVNGSLLWKYKTEGSVSGSPAIAKDGTIYFGSSDRNLYALNSDGTLKWKIFIYQSNCSPSIGDDGTIYIIYSSYDLRALNPDGTKKWEYWVQGSLASTPAIGKDGTLFFGNRDQNVFYALNQDGTLLWAYNTEGRVTTYPAIGKDGTIYFGCQDQSLYVLNDDGTLKWKFKSNNYIYSNPNIGDNGNIYFGCSNRNLYALKTNNGGLYESTWPCFKGAQNHAGNVNYNDPNAPVAYFSASPTEGMYPLTVQFSDSSKGNITTRLWNFGDGETSTEKNPLYIYNSEGKFTVKLKVENENQSDSETKVDYIEVFDPIKLYAEFIMDNDSGPGPLEVKFTDASTGNIDNWYWDFGDGEVSTLQNPTHTFYNIGYNTVQLIISSGNIIDSIQRNTYVNVKWRSGAGDDFISSPAVAFDGTIYIGNEDNNLHSFNTTGTRIWKYNASDNVTSSPAIGKNNIIYFGSRYRYLSALNPDGTLQWRYRTGGYISSSPAIGNDGTIYVGSDDNNVYAFNSNGTVKWKYETGDDVYSSPAIGKDGTIYAGSEDYSFYALNSNGTLKWKYTTGDVIRSSPAIDDNGTIYVGSFDNNLYAFNPDGTLQWNFTVQNYIYSSPSIGFDGTIYVGSSDSCLYAINDDGTEKWKYKTGGPVSSSPAIGSDGTIFIGSYDRYFYAFNQDGSVKWKYETEAGIHSSPTIGSDGTVYVGDRINYLYAFASKNSGLAKSSWPCFRQNARHTGNIDEIVHSEINEFNNNNIRCYPNPFNQQTTIEINIENTGYTQLDIFNIRGEKIKTFVSNSIPIGNHKISWNGTNNDGIDLSSGIYFIKLLSNHKIQTDKIILIR